MNMNEWLSRSAPLLGAEALEKLAAARVAVAGIGGVGSFAVEALARGGVGRLLLIDHDRAAPSNINRQLHAAVSTVGQLKVELMARRVADINPHARVEAREAFLLPDNVTALLDGPLDYIIDAVDTVSAKLALVEEAQRRGVPIISCMGTGNKLDPTRFRVGDIYETSVCPLCRVMRRELRQRGTRALQVVYSTETPRTPPPDPALRRQVPGSVSFVPPVAGMIAAGVVIRGIAGISL